ncbi:MAG: hypothetical protein IKR18_05270 [Bacteroidaceae bacterium]|nr:hypothetical protein [Bacteroidaceae bacterium]
MMKLINKRLYTQLLLTALPLLALAQGRILPVDDLPGSAASCAHGGSSFVLSEAGNIYSGIFTSSLIADGTTEAGYSLGLIDGKSYSMSFHTITAAHRSGNNVVMAGARYFAQGKIDRMVDIDMKPVEGSIRLYSYTADVGYAHVFNSLTLSATIGVASEKTTSQLNAYRASIGATYSGKISSIDYLIGAGVRDAGMYSVAGKSKALAPLLHAGGAVVLPLSANHQFGLNVDGGVYVESDNSKTSPTLSGGLDYTFMRNYTLRVGGHTGDDDNYMGTGLSVRLGRCVVDAAAKIAFEEGLSNCYMFGIKADF